MTDPARMTSPANGKIDHVSDTARWEALYRALESERDDALFHDPFARGLAGAKGLHLFSALN